MKPGSRLSISAIISGGQTGVDRAALDFAIDHGFTCGGWCPRGRRSEDGKIPEKYPLKETGSTEYRVRTRKNILSTDGTLIIVHNGLIDRGTRLTNSLCETLCKPVFIATHIDQKQKFGEWISNNQIHTLNVAGCRESAQPGIYDFAYRVLKSFLT